MRSFLKYLSLSMTLLVSFTAHSATIPWQKISYISNSFYEIALGNEYGVDDYRIRKWVKPIKVYVEHAVGDQQLQDLLVNAHLQHLSSITALDIRRVTNIKQANVKFFFTNQQNLNRLTDKYSGKFVARINTTKTCIATISLNASAEVSSAQIYIPVDFAYRKGKLVACIVEELTQVLGLPRDSDKVFPSIFNDKSTDDLLTGLDETLLRILYDPKIKAGMGKPVLAKILKPIIRKLADRGWIPSASLRVKQSRLYALLDY